LLVPWGWNRAEQAEQRTFFCIIIMCYCRIIIRRNYHEMICDAKCGQRKSPPKRAIY